MKNRNIRINLKKYSQPTEVLVNQLPYSSQNIEEENNRIQSEAKNLIAKTRKIMENLDMNKLPKEDFSRSLRVTRSRSKSKDAKSHSRESNFSFSPFKTIEEVGHIISESPTIAFKNHMNINLTDINNRLLEKTKTIKYLEKELKDRNSLINKLHEKLDKKNEEIANLNDALAVFIFFINIE
jgi:hypothetical protein